MAYDTYGRPLRGNGEPGYFGTHDSLPDYANDYSSEPRHNDPSLRPREWDSVRHRRSPPLRDSKMPSGSDFAEASGLDGVSPEVIAILTAKITENVKREGKS
jgi:hypothetical protein